MSYQDKASRVVCPACGSLPGNRCVKLSASARAWTVDRHGQMAGQWRKGFHPERIDVVREPAKTPAPIPGVDYDESVCSVCGGSHPHDHPEEMVPLCRSCGSAELWSNWFGPDGFATDGSGDGDVWATFCSDCGAEQP